MMAESAASGQSHPRGRTRYVLASMVMVTLFLVSLMRTSLSVAIVAMVKPRPPRETDATNGSGAGEVCPGEVNASSSTSQGGGEMSWSELEQGYVLSAYAYGATLSALALSRLAESLGAGKVLLTLAVTSSALNLLGPVAARAGIFWLVGLLAAQGFLWGPLCPCVALLSARWFPPDERNRISGYMFSAGNMGTIASMGLSGIVVTRLGWPALFYGYGTALLCWSALCLLTITDNPSTHRWISAEEKNYLHDVCPHIPKELPPVPWCHIMASGPVWAYVLHDSGCFWISSIFNSELPTYLSSILHFDLEKAGYLSMLPFISNWISNVLSGSCAHWLRQKGILSHLTCYRVFNGLAMLGPALVLLGVVWVGCDSVAVMGLVTLAMALHGAYFGGSLFNMLDLSVVFTGTLAGLANTSVGIVSVAVPTLVGFITNGQETISAWRAVFYASAAITVVPYVLFFFLGSVEEQPWGRTDKSPAEEEKAKP